MKQFLHKYNHIWTALYMVIYLIWFGLLEARHTQYRVMHVPLDDQIPFCEYFIIPYLLWFVFIAATFIYFFFQSKEEYYRLAIYMFSGMTICLIIYTFWPNGQNLRMDINPDKNIFTRLVSMIYSADNNENVCPSIHVFNTLGACVAIFKSKCIKKNSWLKPSVTILSVLIILSTMFLKQHSVVDVLCAFVLAIIMYVLVYGLPGLFKKKSNKKTI